jgi:type IV pilus assembly protein PilW
VRETGIKKATLHLKLYAHRVDATTWSRSRKLGLSLVELLVAMLIGLFLTSGIFKVMLNGKSQFIIEQEIASLQENARYIIDEMTRDMRMADYFGCSSKAVVTNTLNLVSGVTAWYLNSRGIVGFEETHGALPAGFPSAANTIVADTDIVIINRAIPDDTVIMTSHNTMTRLFTIETMSSKFRRGDVLAIASRRCNQVSIFQMYNNAALPSQANPVIKYSGAPAAVAPGNCEDRLFGFEDCSNTVAAENKEFPAGSQLMRFSSSAYYVANSANTGLPTLWRETLVRRGVTAQAKAQELISGVEDIQLIYGVDTDATLDGIANQYFDANEIHDWSKVVSLNLTLILRSARHVYSINTATRLDFDVDKDGSIETNGDDDYDDRYLRKKISTTIKIRNRGLGV